MGVPKFYKWISERYPRINQIIKGDVFQPEFDCLYLDMNGIVHNCTHNDQGAYDKTEDEMFSDIMKYIDMIFHIVKPRSVLYMALDGVAPRAKINQQRQRRYRSAQDRKKARAEAIQRGEAVKDGPEFDSNCITPGTEFMERLGQYLRYFVHHKQTHDRLWQRCRVLLSASDVPGEGEHKIMLFIRQLKMQPWYTPHMRHCLYGLDADLIMLSLVTHEPHFALLREEVVFGGRSSRRHGNRKVYTKLGEFQYLHISALRNYMDAEYKLALRGKTMTEEYSIERVIDDFVFLVCLVGNDFLPHLPTLDIGDGGLDMLLDTYKQLLPTMGYLTDRGELDTGRLVQIWKALAKVEEKVLAEKDRDYKKFAKRQARMGNPIFMKKRRPKINTTQHQRPAGRKQPGVTEVLTEFNNVPGAELLSAPVLGPDGLPVGHVLGPDGLPVPEGKTEAPKSESAAVPAPSKRSDKSLNLQVDSQFAKAALDVRTERGRVTKKDGVYVPVGESRLADYGALESDSDSDEKLDEELALSEMTFVGRYYRERLPEFFKHVSDEYLEEKGLLRDYVDGYTKDKTTKQCISQLCREYMRGLVWVLRYYYQGCCSWSWFYPYRYAPLASDLLGLSGDIDVMEFDLAKPFEPLVQLLSTLPPASASLLPEPYQELMLRQGTTVSAFFPKEFNIDMNGKYAEWEGIALVPFLDAGIIQEQVDLIDPRRLTQGERDRGIVGSEWIFAHDEKQSVEVAPPPSSRIFPLLRGCPVRCDKFMLPLIPPGDPTVDGGHVIPAAEYKESEDADQWAQDSERYRNELLKNLAASNCVESTDLYNRPPVQGRFNPVLCRGVTQLPGQPWFHAFDNMTWKYTRAGITVFGRPSRKESVVAVLDDSGSEWEQKLRREIDDLTSQDHEDMKNESGFSEEELLQRRLAREDIVNALEEKRVTQLASQYVGRTVWIGWPYFKEALVVSACDAEFRYLQNWETLREGWRKKGGRVPLTSHEANDVDETAHALERATLAKWGVAIGEVEVVLSVRRFDRMHRKLDGSEVRVWREQEEYVPLQLVRESHPLPDPRWIERGPASIEHMFPKGQKVIYLGPDLYGMSGRVVSVNKPASRLEGNGSQSSNRFDALNADDGDSKSENNDSKEQSGAQKGAAGAGKEGDLVSRFFTTVDLEVDVRPDMPADAVRKIVLQNQLPYFPAYKVANMVGVSSLAVSLVSGHVRVDPTKDSIGLGLKFTGDMLCCADYCRGEQQPSDGGRTKVDWQYSSFAVAMLQLYNKKYPNLFKRLTRYENMKKLHINQVMEIDERAAKTELAACVKDVMHFVSKLPSSRDVLVPLTTRTVPRVLCRFLAEQTAKAHQHFANHTPGKVLLRNVPLFFLYRPDPSVPWSPSEVAGFELGDRVLSLRSDNSVPLAMRGVVVGKHHIPDESFSEYQDKSLRGQSRGTVRTWVEILWDDTFVGGDRLYGKCPDMRGKTVPETSLLNLSTIVRPKVKVPREVLAASKVNGKFKHVKLPDPKSEVIEKPGKVRRFRFDKVPPLLPDVPRDLMQDRQRRRPNYDVPADEAKKQSHDGPEPQRQSRKSKRQQKQNKTPSKPQQQKQQHQTSSSTQEANAWLNKFANASKSKRQPASDKRSDGAQTQRKPQPQQQQQQQQQHRAPPRGGASAQGKRQLAQINVLKERMGVPRKQVVDPTIDDPGVSVGGPAEAQSGGTDGNISGPSSQRKPSSELDNIFESKDSSKGGAKSDESAEKDTSNSAPSGPTGSMVTALFGRSSQTVRTAPVNNPPPQPQPGFGQPYPPMGAPYPPSGAPYPPPPGAWGPGGPYGQVMMPAPGAFYGYPPQGGPAPGPYGGPGQWGSGGGYSGPSGGGQGQQQNRQQQPQQQPKKKGGGGGKKWKKKGGGDGAKH